MPTGKLSVRLVCSVLGNPSEKPASIENGALKGLSHEIEMG
jgi:hypothetical protein